MASASTGTFGTFVERLLTGAIAAGCVTFASESLVAQATAAMVAALAYDLFSAEKSQGPTAEAPVVTPLTETPPLPEPLNPSIPKYDPFGGPSGMDGPSRHRDTTIDQALERLSKEPLKETALPKFTRELDAPLTGEGPDVISTGGCTDRILAFRSHRTKLQNALVGLLTAENLASEKHLKRIAETFQDKFTLWMSKSNQISRDSLVNTCNALRAASAETVKDLEDSGEPLKGQIQALFVCTSPKGCIIAQMGSALQAHRVSGATIHQITDPEHSTKALDSSSPIPRLTFVEVQPGDKIVLTAHVGWAIGCLPQAGRVEITIGKNPEKA